MIALFIIAGCTIGGVTIGLMMLVVAMFYNGKWTLPGTAQRQIQHAQVQREIERLRAEAAKEVFLREQIDANRERFARQHLAEMEQMSDALFTRQLEAPRPPSTST